MISDGKSGWGDAPLLPGLLPGRLPGRLPERGDGDRLGRSGESEEALYSGSSIPRGSSVRSPGVSLPLKLAGVEGRSGVR